MVAEIPREEENPFLDPPLPEGSPTPEVAAPEKEFDYEARRKEIVGRFSKRAGKVTSLREAIFGDNKRFDDALSSAQEHQKSRETSVQEEVEPLAKEEELALALSNKMNEINDERKKAIEELETKKHEDKMKEIKEI